MTFQKLFTMKFKEGVSTIELERRFPRERRKIYTLALLELPSRTLRRVVGTRKEFEQLSQLKQKLFKVKSPFPPKRTSLSSRQFALKP